MAFANAKEILADRAVHSSRGYHAPTQSSLNRAAVTLGVSSSPRPWRTNSVRDIDLHPDAHIATSESPGIVRRAKRSISAQLESPRRKLQRAAIAAKDGAQTFQDAATAAATAAAEKVQQASRTIEAMEGAMDDRLKAVEEAIGSGVEVLQAHAANAIQSVHEHALSLEKAVGSGVTALQEKANTAVCSVIWEAMSYMAPRVKWSNLVTLNFNVHSPTQPNKPKAPVPTFAEVQAEAEKLEQDKTLMYGGELCAEISK